MSWRVSIDRSGGTEDVQRNINKLETMLTRTGPLYSVQVRVPANAVAASPRVIVPRVLKSRSAMLWLYWPG